jgi:hypothetical protein
MLHENVCIFLAVYGTFTVVSSGFPYPNFLYLLYFPFMPHAPPIHLDFITKIIYCEELKS